ncbi:MAG: hypothetical protein GXP61_08210 [Epsilonproteobacteria bacterium]|nr:hypothetical protein [Campylobacterota bacterium]
MKKSNILKNLKEVSLRLDDIIDFLKEYQAKKQEQLKTDEDIKEYRTLKEVIHLLEEVA